MNLLYFDPSDAARVIKSRIARNGRHRVFVRRSGVVSCYPTWDERSARCPDCDLVGTYDQRASVIDIEGDLQERLREIRS